ncbi:MAG: hypothetical protein M5U14_04560 [Acidimicrobiia bacterium]|nr:hypothetical protein [Acidimicrobiia bacterium]
MASGDTAELSSLRSQLDELTTRVETVADRYRDTPDSAIATNLYAAERALVGARRHVDRALADLADQDR